MQKPRTAFAPVAALVAVVAVFWAAAGLAQGAVVPFGGLRHDASLPVEISADQLKIDQGNGTVVFTGHVVIGQGEMRITAGKVVVEYAASNGKPTGRIRRLVASDGVTVTNGAEAAEAARAEYSIDNAKIVMTGKVILTQGANALSSESMVIDLNTGTAAMSGRVRSILQSGTGQ